MRHLLAYCAGALCFSLPISALAQPLIFDGPGLVARRAGMIPVRAPSQLVASAAQPLAALTAPAGAQLTYYGGHVLANVEVVAVFWGGGVDSATQSGIGGFLAAVTTSAFFNWLNEYNTTASGGTNQVIGPGTFAGTITITPSATATSLQDSDIQTEINQQIDAGNLPAPTANTLYMTYFPPGITITMQNAKSCVDFCGYHGTFTRASASTFYAVLPDLGSNGCNLGCGSGATTFDNLTAASSHELTEAVTDAEIGLATGSTPSAPLAWYDAANGEIGDICVGQTDAITGADGTSYVVQKEFSNVANDCILAR